MGRRTGPRRGSLAFYPRKRAKRIYPSVHSFRLSDKPGLQAFACYKAGMTQVIATDSYEHSPAYGQQVSIPATVLECPPLFAFGVRAYKKNYEGLKSFSEVLCSNPPKWLERRVLVSKNHAAEKNKSKIEKNLGGIAEFRLLLCTQPRKIRFKKTPEVFELTVSGKPQDAWNYCLGVLGKELALKELFAEGDFVDAIAITTGKGTAGPVKRFGIKVQRRKAHGHTRFPGAIGGWNPSRVFWTVPMRGQLGFQRRTELNKRILKIGDNGVEVTPSGGFQNYGVVYGEYVLVEGSVPGPKKRLVFLRKPMRFKKPRPAHSILKIITSPQ